MLNVLSGSRQLSPFCTDFAGAIFPPERKCHLARQKQAEKRGRKNHMTARKKIAGASPACQQRADTHSCWNMLPPRLIYVSARHFFSSSSRPMTTRCPREPGRSDACYPSYLYEVYHTGDTWVSGAGQFILQQGFSDASSGNIQPRSSINHRPTPKQSICAIDFFDKIIIVICCRVLYNILPGWC